MRYRRYLKSKDPDQLAELCLKNNLKYGTDFNYEPVFFAKGFFYTWYNVTLELSNVTVAITEQQQNRLAKEGKK